MEKTMNHDPANHNEDVAQDMALAQAEGRLRLPSQKFARRRQIDIARRYVVHLRALPSLTRSVKSSIDPAQIVVKRDLVQAIESLARHSPHGKWIIKSFRQGWTVRQATIASGLGKSRTSELLAAFKKQARALASGEPL
jgi:hypothetical protein